MMPKINKMNKERPSICFNTTLLITLNTFLRKQSEELIKKGWSVTWVCSYENNIESKIPQDVNLVIMPFKRGNDLFGAPIAILKLYKLYKQSRFDIVQYSTPNSAFYSSIASRMAGVHHRIYAQWGIRYVGFSGIYRRFYKILEKITCLNSTVIEPDSLSNLKFALKEKLYSKDKGRVIWNGSACGIDINKFDIGKKPVWRESIRNNLGYSTGEIVIGFVGSIRKDKGVNEILTACRKLFLLKTNYRLMLIGDKAYYDTISPNLRNWADTSNQVKILPPSDEIPKLLSCMDIFLLPSYREGFGMVVIEAEAMGIPVIVSNIPGPVDAISEDITGISVPVRDSDSLAEAIEKLADDYDLRSKMGLDAVEFVKENFEQKEFMRHVLQDKTNILNMHR